MSHFAPEHLADTPEIQARLRALLGAPAPCTQPVPTLAERFGLAAPETGSAPAGPRARPRNRTRPALA